MAAQNVPKVRTHAARAISKKRPQLVLEYIQKVTKGSFYTHTQRPCLYGKVSFPG